MEQQELRNQHFNVKKYRKRPKNVMTAGGFVKVGTPTSSAVATKQMKIVTNKNNKLLGVLAYFSVRAFNFPPVQQI